MKTEQVKLSPEAVLEYLKAPFHCPKCQSSDISGGSIDIDGTVAHQEVTCQACGFEWQDAYRHSYFCDEHGVEFEAPKETHHAAWETFWNDEGKILVPTTGERRTDESIRAFIRLAFIKGHEAGKAGAQ